MPYRLVILGSGSRGNSLLVSNGRGRLLIDMGFSQRRVAAGLAASGVGPEQLSGLFVTHTHGDHVGDAALKFCWRHGVPLVAARENLDVLRGRLRGMMGRLDRAGLVRELPPRGFDLAGIEVRPFEVPHDAEGLTLGYHLTLGNGSGDAAVRVAVATDLGHVPPEVLRVLSRAEVLVLESNHDGRMLAESGRSQMLIGRIAGDLGHLSNRQAARAVAEAVSRAGPGGVRQVVLAHLSRDCNDPAAALREVKGALLPLGRSAPKVCAASQDESLVVSFRRGCAAV